VKKFIVLILLSLNTSLLCGNELAGYYFGIGLGSGRVESGIKALDKNSTIDNLDLAGKIFAGYTINPYFSIEAHYAQFGNSTLYGKQNDIYVYDGVYYQFSQDTIIKSTSNSFGLSGLIHSKNLGKLSAFAKLGIHSWRTHYSNSAKGYDGNGDERSLNLLYGFGFKCKVNPFLTLRMEIDKFEFNNKNASMFIFATEIRADILEVILGK
jgi:hypothetical protein